MKKKEYNSERERKKDIRHKDQLYLIIFITLIAGSLPLLFTSNLYPIVILPLYFLLFFFLLRLIAVFITNSYLLRFYSEYCLSAILTFCAFISLLCVILFFLGIYIPLSSIEIVGGYSIVGFMILILVLLKPFVDRTFKKGLLSENNYGFFLKKYEQVIDDLIWSFYLFFIFFSLTALGFCVLLCFSDTVNFKQILVLFLTMIFTIILFLRHEKIKNFEETIIFQDMIIYFKLKLRKISFTIKNIISHLKK